MARAQVATLSQSGDSAPRFKGLKILAVNTLSPSCLDQLLSFGCANVGSLKDLVCNCLILILYIGFRESRCLSFRMVPLGPQKTFQGTSHCRVYLRQIGALVSAAVCLDRRVFWWQRRSKNIHVLRWTNWARKQREPNRYSPALVSPCLSRFPELFRPRHHCCSSGRNSECSNCSG